MALQASVIVVLDGHAAAGKGTLARLMAEALGYDLFDSGSAYRAIAARMLETGRDPAELAAELVDAHFDRPDLRSKEVNAVVATISSNLKIRHHVNNYWRRKFRPGSGVVIDGRAGAYEYPEAAVKLFLTADVDVRAKRRHVQALQSEDEKLRELPLEAHRQNIVDRDRLDESREIFPLHYEPTLYHERIDNTSHTNEHETLRVALEVCREVLATAA